MKRNRHEAILSLVEKEELGTQEELMCRLHELGYNVTQATVSRDIKALKLVKSPVENGRYKYSAAKNENEDMSQKFFSILTHSVTGADYAGNMVVVKCISGMAGAACEAIDNLVEKGVVGTLAGDNTFFVLCRDEKSAGDFCEKIKRFADGN
ncbi:MAG: arginine repressor [Oscillospiraceae bacterium]|nr:arginine repressor [Oscillospiraceae bacterium]MDD7292373.1 arginine repressor [Clostridiaceae bacterium]MDY5990945.1 arginine repressor [Oscillospiraceae bacterium]